MEPGRGRLAVYKVSHLIGFGRDRGNGRNGSRSLQQSHNPHAPPLKSTKSVPPIHQRLYTIISISTVINTTRPQSHPPEIERRNQETLPQQQRSNSLHDRIIIRPSQRPIRMRNNSSMSLPWRRPRTRSERERMVDSTVEGDAVVEAGEGKGQGRFGKHYGRWRW